MRKFLALAVLALLGVTAPAYAHTTLFTSEPSADSIVTIFPNEISLTFNEPLLTLEGGKGNALSLSAPNGSEIALEKPTIEGGKVSALIPQIPTEPGRYRISYRVVSGDGHPVAGEISFAFQSDSVIAPAPSTSATPTSSEKLKENGETGKALVIFALLAGGALFAYLRFIGKK